MTTKKPQTGKMPLSSNAATNNRKIVRKRWGRKVTLLILFLVCIVWGWQKLTNPQTFPIRDVTITGDQTHISHQALRSIITPYLAQGMLWLQTEQLQNALQQIPWIYQVSVQKKWPHTLWITVTPQTPVAHWNKTELLSKQLKIFDPGNSPAQRSLPWLEGPDAQVPDIWQGYLALDAILVPTGLSIQQLIFTPEHSWEIVLSNGLQLILGETEIPMRLTHFVQMYHTLFAAQVANISYIDLRYNDGFAVKWKNNLLIHSAIS